MAQSLQSLKKETAFNEHPKAKKRDTRRVAIRMNEFRRKYEELAGNISATCKQTRISRQTFYRWMNPKHTAPVYKRFQRRILHVSPIDLLLDAAELTISQKVANGDLTAAMFVINKLGYKRGWTERPEALAQAQQHISDATATAVRSYQMWLGDNPNARESEKSEWLSRFARNAGTKESEMIKAMKIEELSEAIT